MRLKERSSGLKLFKRRQIVEQVRMHRSPPNFKAAKQLLDAKGKATAQAAARQQQHRYVITSYKQAMYSRSAAGVIELLT